MAKTLDRQGIENIKPGAGVSRYWTAVAAASISSCSPPAGKALASATGTTQAQKPHPRRHAHTGGARRPKPMRCKVAQGSDPAAQKVAARAGAEKDRTARAADTVEQWAAHFIERHAKKKTRTVGARAVHVSTTSCCRLPGRTSMTSSAGRPRAGRIVAEDGRSWPIGRSRTCPSSSTGYASATSSPRRLAPRETSRDGTRATASLRRRDQGLMARLRRVGGTAGACIKICR